MGRRILVAAVALAALSTGCDKGPRAKSDDELTIVVQQDKGKLALEEAEIVDKRKELSAELDRLKGEIDKLEAQRAGLGEEAKAQLDAHQALLKRALSLAVEHDALAQKRDALSRERDELLERVGRIPGAPEPSGPQKLEVAAREKDVAQRERGIAEREREMAEREKALAQREAALATAKEPAPVQDRKEATPADAEHAVKALLSAMDAKGLLSSDLSPEGQKALRTAEKSAKSDPRAALRAAQTAQAAVDGVAVDASFVSQKMKRLSVTREAKTQKEVAKLLEQVTRSFSDGHYDEANRALNSIAALGDR